MKINELFNVSGKVAVVTGGSRGIGEMIAAGLLGEWSKGLHYSKKRSCSDRKSQ